MVMVPPVLILPDATNGTAELALMAPSDTHVSRTVAREDSSGSATVATKVTAMRLPLAGVARQAGLGRLISRRHNSTRTVVRAVNFALPPTPTAADSSLSGSGMIDW